MTLLKLEIIYILLNYFILFLTYYLYFLILFLKIYFGQILFLLSEKIYQTQTKRECFHLLETLSDLHCHMLLSIKKYFTFDTWIILYNYIIKYFKLQ
jgi:hypothetical protein